MAQGDGNRQGRIGHASGSLARAVAGILDPAARRRGFAAASLLADWPAIVGTALARRCQPAALQPARGSAGGTLVLHATGAAALEVQHAIPQLVERINGHFGFRAVRHVRLVQAPLPPRPVPAPSAARALTDQEAAQVEATVASVGDDDLRDALARLGRSIKARRPG